VLWELGRSGNGEQQAREEDEKWSRGGADRPLPPIIKKSNSGFGLSDLHH
jgi:hypothetical protein